MRSRLPPALPRATGCRRELRPVKAQQPSPSTVGAFGQVGQAAAAAALDHADAVILDSDMDDVRLDDDRHVDLSGLRVPRDVGQGLPDDCQHIKAQPFINEIRVIECAHHREPRSKAERFGETVDQVVQLVGQRLGLGLVQGEDHPADVLDRQVELVDGLRKPVLDIRMGRHPRRGLQPQARREKSLDHDIVHVAGDPLAVLKDNHPRPVPLCGRRSQRDRSQVGILLQRLSSVVCRVRLTFPQATTSSPRLPVPTLIGTIAV